MRYGKYYASKCRENKYDKNLKKCIEDACQYCIDNVSKSTNGNYKGEHPLMMLGKIQSGKTKAFTGVMALAFDNNFDYVFILTKNSKALVEQTYKRMRNEFKSFIDNDEVDVSDIMKLQDDLTSYELEKHLIFIAKKQKDNLVRICNFIKDYMIRGDKKCLIIDDEADTSGVGYEKIKSSKDEFDLRTVAAEVNRIRGSLDGYVFLQVTATPYALYLQPEFDGKNIKPIKPMKTVLVPSGETYVGGEDYFINFNEENSPGRFVFEEVSDAEQKIASAKTTDRRKFKEEEILIREDRMSILKKGIVNFIMGGCIMEHNGIKKKYSYVIHTAVAKAAHTRLAEITRIFIEKLEQKLPEEQKQIERLLRQSYDDIGNSIVAYGYAMPRFEEAKASFYKALNKGYVKISVINSEDDINKYLNEDTGELKLRTPFSIFVGGQVLDRGITIPNMVGFYYGRNPKTMQQDTVMQHSRMFGYRGSDLLAITRFYTTRKIYESMIKITEIDKALREDLDSERFEEGVYFIESKPETLTSSKIIPCSPSKISVSNIVYLKPFSRILPIGFTPKAKAISAVANRNINTILDSIINRNQVTPVLVSIEIIEKLLKEIFNSLQPDEDSNRFISGEKMISILRYLSKESNQCYLIVRREREVQKFKENGGYSDAPDNGRDESKMAREIAVDDPCVILLQENGNNECWKFREFWWPVLVVPKNAPKTVYALADPGETIKSRM